MNPVEVVNGMASVMEQVFRWGMIGVFLILVCFTTIVVWNEIKS